MLIVEVCQGPDCSGGGAALLEIEELIQEETQHSFCLAEGGCRELCTVGPNVHIRDKHHGAIESFHNVKDVSKCAVVLQEAVRLDSPGHVNDSLSDGLGSRQSIMIRRAERMRWDALKNISRKLSKCKKDINNNPDILDDVEKRTRKMKLLKEEMSGALDQSSNAEISATNDLIGRDRAQRRRKRLDENISRRLGEYFED